MMLPSSCVVEEFFGGPSFPAVRADTFCDVFHEIVSDRFYGFFDEFDVKVDAMFSGSDIVFSSPEIGKLFLYFWWYVTEESDVDVGVSGFVGFDNPDVFEIGKYFFDKV